MSKKRMEYKILSHFAQSEIWYVCLLCCASIACDDGGSEGLPPAQPGAGMTAGMTAGENGGTMTGGVTAGDMMGGMTAGTMSTGGTSSTGGTMTTVIPPMDDAGLCFEACLNLMLCQNSGILSCGAATRAAYAATCQRDCLSNGTTINAATNAGCGSESNTISTLGLSCVDDSLCAEAMCPAGDLCQAGQCTPFSCAPDQYDSPGNDNQEQAFELAFEPLVAEGLSLCNGDRDWYVVDIPPNASLRVDFGFQDQQADVDVRSYDDTGMVLFSSVSGTDNERLTFTPSEEMRRVYIEVFVFSSQGSPEDPEMTPMVSSTTYNMYIATNLPAPICRLTSSCNDGDLCNQDAGLCAPPPPCTSDDECGYSGLCDIPSGRCIDCFTTEDCSSGVCDTSSNECVGCLANTDCVSDPIRGVCDQEAQRCVECANDSDCADGTCNEGNRCIPNSCNDAQEPNDDVMTATELTFNGGVAEVNGYICGDDDWFVFNAAGGENILISLLFADITGDLELALTTPDGTEMSRVSSNDNEIIGLPNAIAGQYKLKVYGAGFQVNQYTLRIEQNAAGMVCNADDQCGEGRCDSRGTALCLPAGYCETHRDCEVDTPICDAGTNRCKSCNRDAFEPNDDQASAVPAMSVQGQLNTCGGSDFFAVNAGPGQTIVAEIMFIDDLGDVDLKLYDAQLMELDRSAGTGDGERIEYLVETNGGTFFLEVYGYNGVYNEYTMSVTVQ